MAIYNPGTESWDYSDQGPAPEGPQYNPLWRWHNSGLGPLYEAQQIGTPERQAAILGQLQSRGLFPNSPNVRVEAAPGELRPTGATPEDEAAYRQQQLQWWQGREAKRRSTLENLATFILPAVTAPLGANLLGPGGSLSSLGPVEQIATRFGLNALPKLAQGEFDPLGMLSSLASSSFGDLLGGTSLDPFEVDAMQTSGFLPGMENSPLMQFASNQGMTDVPNLPWLESEMLPDQSYGDFFGDQTGFGIDDLYPGAGTMVSSAGYPASTSSLVNPLAELGLSSRTGLPGLFSSGTASGISPSALSNLASMFQNPDAYSLPKEKFNLLEKLGVPEDWQDALGGAARYVTQDPLGRFISAGVLSYLSQQAQQNQAETAAQQAAAAAAARQRQFDSSSAPVSGTTQRRYLGGPDSYSRYGMGPEHRFWDEVPVTGARGGPLSRLTQGKGGGQSDQIPALLSDGEYVIDAATVSDLGDGSNDEGARRLDRMRAAVRRHKGRRKGLPPKARAPEQYMKG